MRLGLGSRKVPSFVYFGYRHPVTNGSQGIPSCPGKVLFSCFFFFCTKFLGEFVAWAVVDRSIKFPDISLHLPLYVLFSSPFFSHSPSPRTSISLFFSFIQVSLTFRFTAYWSRFVVPFLPIFTVSPLTVMTGISLFLLIVPH